MGTTYTLIEKNNITLDLDEMSNKFDLILWEDLEPDHALPEMGNNIEIPDLTVEDVTEIALEMIKACSYWAKDRDYMERVAERVRNLY